MSVTRKKAVSIHHVKNIIMKLDGVKDIVYYAICLPEQFANWLRDGEVSAEDRLTLKYVSDRIRHSIFSTSASSAELVIVSEDEATVIHRSLFELSVTIRLELQKWRLSLQGWLPAGANLVVAKTALINIADEFVQLLDIRDSILTLHCSWRSLPQDKIGQLEDVMKEFELLKKSQQFVIDTMIKADTGVSMLMHKHTILMQHMKELFSKQMELERQLYNRTMLERFQHAMINLMNPESAKDNRWLRDTLTNNHEFRHAISQSISRLMPLQYDFTYYLARQSAADRVTDENIVRFGLDCLVMNSMKESARTAYQERVEQELAFNQAAFFSDKLKVEQQYQIALDSQKRGDYQAALKGFLQGTLKMHAMSFHQAGEMILQGQGCSADAALASYFMLIAHGLEECREIRISLLVSMQKADALAVIDNEKRADKNVNPDVDAYLMTDADLMKKIYFMKVSVMERLFRLGEALILMVIMRETACDKNTAIFKRACFFFEYAYKYIKGAYDRKIILRDKNTDQRAELVRECVELNKKVKQCQQDIIVQFSYMEGNMYCQSASVIIADFYERFEFDVAISPRLAAGMKL